MHEQLGGRRLLNSIARRRQIVDARCEHGAHALSAANVSLQRRCIARSYSALACSGEAEGLARMGERGATLVCIHLLESLEQLASQRRLDGLKLRLTRMVDVLKLVDVKAARIVPVVEELCSAVWFEACQFSREPEGAFTSVSVKCPISNT